MLPGTGRGGYATLGSEACMSRYTRFGPRPIVVVATPFKVRSRGGMREDFLGGRAGLGMADVKPIVSGTGKYQGKELN